MTSKDNDTHESILTETGLKAWKLYFPNEEYTAFNKEISLIIEIRKALDLNTTLLKTILDTGIFECDFTFFSQFSCAPTMLKCFNCAVSERIYERFNQLILVETRIINHNEISTFRDITTEKVDTLVTLIGTCCRAGFKKIENLVSFFECAKCSRVLNVVNQNNIYKMPKCSCKGKTFVFLPNHPETKCVDKQEIKLQEIFTNDNNTRVMEVDLYGTLVGTIVPGDLIQLTGIVRAELVDDAYKLKIECNNLQVIKNRNCFKNDEDFQTDFQTFKKISEEPNLISILINNLYPNIYGNTLIKAGLILALFGGSRKYVGSQPARSEIHVLIVGDPGLGKSKLLLNTSGIIPKSTYISGSFCTTAGLTVSINHDSVTGEYMADAGALVVSDGGVCCIDEFDKIDDHTALFEAMEDQTVTVAKGGVCCSVPTRSTVIAASNPKNGHFDTKRSIQENLKFDPFLISRFDLVFILKDDLNEQENYEMGNHILKKRHYSTDETISTLVKNLRSDSFIQNSDVVYDQDILKQYIEYARITVSPVLSKTAKQKIKDYYLSLRKNHRTSVRNLESLIRLTEACAKMELKSTATTAHAQFAIDLYKKAFVNEEKTTVESTKKKSVEGLLKEFVDERGSIISREALVLLIQKSCSKKSEREVIETLNFQGVIVKKGDDEFKIVL